MNKPLELKVGQEVTYRDVNLLSNRGVIVEVRKGEHGGDCFVKWNGFDFLSEQCSFNLMPR